MPRTALDGSLSQLAWRRRDKSRSAPIAIALFLASAPLGAPAARAAEAALTVEASASCEAMAPNYCLGAYGFRILPDGAFASGPSRSGRMAGGRLAPSDARSLHHLAQRVLRGFDDPRATCAARPSRIPGVSETIVVTGGGKAIALHGLGGMLDPQCAAAGASDAAALFKRTHELMARRYPRPFL